MTKPPLRSTPTPADQQGSELLGEALERANISDADKTYLITNHWTMSHVPEIRSNRDYQRYESVWRELNVKLQAENPLPPTSDPDYVGAFTKQSRSPAGLLVDAIAARISEWEER